MSGIYRRKTFKLVSATGLCDSGRLQSLFTSMRVCPNRGQSCGKPKECGWKLFLRGAESTRRCVSVAFLGADKRCLENCRNFSHRAAGWREGRGEGSGEKRRFRPAKRTRFSRGSLGGTLTRIAHLAREREMDRSMDRSREIERGRRKEHPPDQAYPRDREAGDARKEGFGVHASARKRPRSFPRTRRDPVNLDTGRGGEGKEGKDRRVGGTGPWMHQACGSGFVRPGPSVFLSPRVSPLAPGSYSYRLWQFPRRTL